MRTSARPSIILMLAVATLPLLTPSAKADTVAFFYALDADLQGLKTVARELGQASSIGTRSIQRLRLGSHTVHAVKMGSGAVETAASAQALLSRNRCDWAFSLGPAGALADTIGTGCWYRVDKVIAWQHGSSTSVSPADFPSWNTDWGKLLATNVPLPLAAASNIAIASGEQFISTSGDRDRLQALSQADAVDMNSYGLALVCADHGVPLFSWKVVSDRADEEASVTFRAFISAYSGEGGKALAEVILSLPANPNDPSSYPAIERALREAGGAVPAP
jgi:nucleoside phosphorylase